LVGCFLFVYESKSINKKALRELQNGAPEGAGVRYLHQSAPQAAPGLVQNFNI